ncbi:hypothetical protein HRG59_11400 [Enterococcus faecalis]|nr:hypothetical protein [Enterococcus faecalis]
MKQEEVIERLKEELNLPFFNGTLEEKNYSEADYQQIKKELIQYFDEYVRNVENEQAKTTFVFNKIKGCFIIKKKK